MFIVCNYDRIMGLCHGRGGAILFRDYAHNSGLCLYTRLWDSGMAARDSRLCS